MLCDCLPGEYLSGWRLSLRQLRHVLGTGRFGGDGHGNVFDTYINLIQRFLGRESPSKAFQAAYIRQFLDEARPLEEPLFLLLDELFGDTDPCTDNPELLAEDPDFYLDDSGLELKARSVLERMRVWRARQMSV